MEGTYLSLLLLFLTLYWILWYLKYTYYDFRVGIVPFAIVIALLFSKLKFVPASEPYEVSVTTDRSHRRRFSVLLAAM